jgi:two-component system sensor histidine kinase QseC
MTRGLNNGRVPSLRWRLLGLVSITAVLILGLAAALSYRQARHEVQELMDGQMSGTAQLMLAQVQLGADHLASLPELIAGQRGLRVRRSDVTLEYQIGSPDGTVLARSPHAPDTALTGALGYSTVNYENQPWRSLMLETANGDFRIQVAQSIPKRDEEAFEIARKTVLPLGVIFPLLLLAIYFSVRRGLKPLDDLAADVLRRSPENLTPLANRSTPREAQPLVAAINRLLFRLNGSLENERRFTADAAHELRTPLAAARIQMQVALLSENPEQRKHAMTQALAGVDRSTRLVEQMLRLARLDPLARLPGSVKIDLAELAQDVAAGVRDSVPEARIDLRLDENTPPVDGDADLLSIALRNLIDNALRYSPPGSIVAVELGRQDGARFLCVSDNGPGVSDEDLPRLVERFYRGSEVNAEGSGLGLTIVHRIAELHSAKLELCNRDGGGFQARLHWPA